MKIAACIVGGLRTFSMPAVYESLLNLTNLWKADTFFYVHNSYQNEDMSSLLKTQGLTNTALNCKTSKSVFDLFHPKKVVYTTYKKACKTIAGSQYEDISMCVAETISNYDIIVRIRPDFYFEKHVELHKNMMNSKVAFSINTTQSDIFFVLNKVTGYEFLSFNHMCFLNMKWKRCCLDLVLPTLIRSHRINVWGGLVRTDRLVRIPENNNRSKIINFLNAKRNKFSCNSETNYNKDSFQVYSEGLITKKEEERLKRFVLS